MRCEVCNIMVGNPGNLANHEKGKAHINKVQKLEKQKLRLKSRSRASESSRGLNPFVSSFLHRFLPSRHEKTTFEAPPLTVVFKMEAVATGGTRRTKEKMTKRKRRLKKAASL